MKKLSVLVFVFLALVAMSFPALASERSTPVAATVYSEVVVLSDTQIKSLPNTPVEIVPAPGNGKMIMPVGVVMSSHQVAAYENVSASNYTAFTFMLSGFGVYGVKNIYSFLTFGADCVLPGSPINLVSVTAGTDSLSEFDNRPLTLALDNEYGNLTGGDPANTLTITVYYFIADL